VNDIRHSGFKSVYLANQVLKNAFKYLFFGLLALFLTALIALLLAFNNSKVQSYLTSQVTDYLSAQFKTKITIDHIKYYPFGGFALDNVYWGDQKNDTLFFVDEVKFNFGGFNKKTLKLTLNDVVVEGGYCKIVTYPDSTFNIDVLFNILDPNDTIPDTTSPPFSLFFNRVACHNTRFRLIDSTEAFEPTGFDGFNQDFHSIEILAKDFWIIKDSLHFDMKKLATTEKCGFRVDQISCIGTICNTGMLFDSIQINTPYSNITRKFNMVYNSWDDVVDFNQKVRLDADLVHSIVDMRDIAFFAPLLMGSKQVFTLNGKGSGTVSNLKLANLNIHFGNASTFLGNGTIKGLPNVDETFFDFKANEAQTNKLDLERLIVVDLPVELVQLGNMKFKGRYTGFIHDFVAYGNFQTALGGATSDLNMKLGDSLTPPSYSGKLVLNDFDMGTLIKLPTIGKISLTAALNGKGFTLNELESSIQTEIDYLEANNYRYKHIFLGGKVEHKMFTGMLEVNDPNAEFNFNGTIDLNKQIPLYRFKADIAYADLQALHFDTSHIVLSTKIDINFAIKDIDQNSGTVKLDKTLFIKNGVDYTIDHIDLLSENNNNQKRLHLSTDMLEAELNGDFSFTNLPSTFTGLVHSLLPDYVKKEVPQNPSAQKFDYTFTLSNSRLLSDLFFPDFNLMDAKLSGSIDERKNEGTLNLTISELLYKQYLIQNIDAKAAVHNNGKGILNLTIDGMQTKDTVIFQELTAKSEVSSNTIRTQLFASDTNALVHGYFNISTQFTPTTISNRFNGSGFAYKHKKFDISNNNLIVYNNLTKNLTVDTFAIAHNRESINIGGFYNLENNYNLSIQVENLELSIINLIYPPINFATSGTTSGKIIVKNNGDNFLVNSFLSVQNLALDNDTIGNFTITSNYDEIQKRLIAQAKSASGKLKDLTLSGFIDMSRSPYAVNADLVFSESDLKSFQAFVKDEVTIFYGKASAKCKISGTTNNIVLDGSISINQVLARVEYLKTVYALNAKINFDKNKMTIVPFQMKDINGHQALVGGTISHQSFSNFFVDLSINQLNGFQVLNTTSTDNSLFYGAAYATGRMSLKGPMEDLLLEATLKSTEGTVFHIPLSDSEDGDGDNLLHFIDKDTTLKSISMKKQSTLLGLGISMNVTVTPDAEIQLVFDETQDDKIIGTGRGILQMNLTKQGVFTMYGEVAIENGAYTFTAIDVFTRKFSLQKGGTITWAGDPLQARLDIQGVYKVRNTSLANLIPSLTQIQKDEVNQKRVPVECILNLKGNLLSPEIGFDINLPDRSTFAGNNASSIENTMRRLRSEPDLMQQQVVSLMLFGQFAPIQNQSNTQTNVSAGINNTLSDLISAQATNVLSNILPGVSVSVDYQNAVGSISQKAILSASKKFLNDRFELQTSVDVMNTNTNNSIIGQYNLRPDGNLKLRGFNRISPNPIYNQNITSRGIGLYYRKEFDSFSELLKRKNKQLTVPNN
jgi:hypothetical protein